MGTTHRDFELPKGLRPTFDTAAGKWLATPAEARSATPPMLSASVLLVRDGEAGVEVFMQHRVASMAFAPSMWVYPGGGVDPGDDAVPPPGAEDVLGIEERQAGQVLSAAVREVFEECGVLFAGTGPGAVLHDAGDQRWSAYRAALLDRSISSTQMLGCEGLVPRYDLLTPVARWVTPECEPRRYDTFFFAATVPSGQVADAHTTEARAGAWVEAGAALRQHWRGSGTLMPPTLVLAEQIARCPTVADYLAIERSMAKVMPEPVLIRDDDGERIVMRAPIDEDGRAVGPAPTGRQGTD
ncbi:MAG: NUDIX hydrolase [Ornithinimicrobium sp.]